MSEDIVEQLREYAEDWQIDRSVVDRAANEIERLRALVEASIILAHPGSLTVNCVRGSVSCQEAKRLRARVEVLEKVREAAEGVAYGYDPDRDMGAIEASVRALIKTLEAQP
jgi:hypothetical protein